MPHVVAPPSQLHLRLRLACVPMRRMARTLVEAAHDMPPSPLLQPRIEMGAEPVDGCLLQMLPPWASGQTHSRHEIQRLLPQNTTRPPPPGMGPTDSRRNAEDRHRSLPKVPGAARPGMMTDAQLKAGVAQPTDARLACRDSRRRCSFDWTVPCGVKNSVESRDGRGCEIAPPKPSKTSTTWEWE
jgi:hypothetical protein